MKIKKIEGLEKVKVPFIEAKAESTFYKDAVHLLGFCFDGTASFKKGARLGPDAIRVASDNLENYSPYLDRDLDDVKLIDLGNLPINYENWYPTNDFFEKHIGSLDLKDSGAKLILLGGEHSVSYGPISWNLKNYPDLVLLHLDAHADLRDGYLEHKFSHASIIRRSLDHFGPGHQLIQYGIRSGTQDEFKYIRENKTICDSLADLLTKLKNIGESRPIYLTLDLDFFDPSFCPGTGTPEAGGESFNSFIEIIRRLSTMNLIGADVVELAPEIDSTGQSSCLAAKVTREIILAIG